MGKRDVTTDTTDILQIPFWKFCGPSNKNVRIEKVMLLCFLDN